MLQFKKFYLPPPYSPIEVRSIIQFQDKWKSGNCSYCISTTTTTKKHSSLIEIAYILFTHNYKHTFYSLSLVLKMAVGYCHFLYWLIIYFDSEFLLLLITYNVTNYFSIYKLYPKIIEVWFDFCVMQITHSFSSIKNPGI